MATNSLISFFLLIKKDRTVLIDTACEKYEQEFKHYAQANNKTPLLDAKAWLDSQQGKNKLFEALRAAMVAGDYASGLTTGYIGAQSGPFSRQPSEVRAHYETAQSCAVHAFRESLKQSLDKPTNEKSEEEKAKEKQARQERANERKMQAVKDAIDSGAVVPASKVSTLTIAQLTLEDLLEELSHRGVTPKQFAAWVKARSTATATA